MHQALNDQVSEDEGLGHYKGSEGHPELMIPKTLPGENQSEVVSCLHGINKNVCVQ